VVPERPLDLVFGGKDGRTLFILTRSALYAVRTRAGGV
jgi:sugar lactone lactonase YvrE